MIYGNVVRQYEESKGLYGGGVNRVNIVDESNYILEALIIENYNYAFLINDISLTESEREILEAKYEVITEAVGAAIIAAIVAVIGAIVAILMAAVKLLGKGASAISSKANGTVGDTKKKDIATQIMEKANNGLKGILLEDFSEYYSTDKIKPLIDDIKKFKSPLNLMDANCRDEMLDAIKGYIPDLCSYGQGMETIIENIMNSGGELVSTEKFGKLIESIGDIGDIETFSIKKVIETASNVKLDIVSVEDFKKGLIALHNKKCESFDSYYSSSGLDKIKAFIKKIPDMQNKVKRSIDTIDDLKKEVSSIGDLIAKVAKTATPFVKSHAKMGRQMIDNKLDQYDEDDDDEFFDSEEEAEEYFNSKKFRAKQFAQNNKTKIKSYGDKIAEDIENITPTDVVNAVNVVFKKLDEVLSVFRNFYSGLSWFEGARLTTLNIFTTFITH